MIKDPLGTADSILFDVVLHLLARIGRHQPTEDAVVSVQWHFVRVWTDNSRTGGFNESYCLLEIPVR